MQEAREFRTTSHRFWGFFTFLLVWGVLETPVWAQTVETARILGLSGARRGLTTDNDAIYLNPAGIGFGEIYSVEAGYVDNFRESDRRINASIVDSQNKPISGGVAYSYSTRRPDSEVTGKERLAGHRIDLALATRLSDYASLGVSGRYLSFDWKVGDESTPGRDFDLFTADAGLQFRGSSGIGFGAAVYNFTNPDRPEAQLSWGAGLGYQGEAFALEGDVLHNLKTKAAAYSGGMTYVISKLVPLRAGVAYDAGLELSTLSAGAGIVLGRFTIDVGYRQGLNAEGPRDEDDQRLLGVSVRGMMF